MRAVFIFIFFLFIFFVVLLKQKIKGFLVCVEVKVNKLQTYNVMVEWWLLQQVLKPPKKTICHIYFLMGRGACKFHQPAPHVYIACARKKKHNIRKVKMY